MFYERYIEFKIKYIVRVMYFVKIYMMAFYVVVDTWAYKNTFLSIGSKNVIFF